MYVNMDKMLRSAGRDHFAVGAFNMVNYLTALAIVKAAEELHSPVIIQTSVATVKQIGVKETITMLRGIVEDSAVPVAVHLDHCTDPDLVIKCIDLGWSSVMIDLSKQSFQANIETTRDIVRYAANKNVSVEGELGAIFGVEDDIKVDDSEACLATPEASNEFVMQTGVSAFAPAIGTAHGLYKGEPKVEYGLFKSIADVVNCALVIHGGTGLPAEAFRRLIALGASKINVSTAVKIAYCQGMQGYLKEHPMENNPLKLDKYVFESVKESVKEYINIFGSRDKAKK